MDPCTINNEEQTLKAIELWKKEAFSFQTRNITKAIESLELSIMYYEQKENSQGICRSKSCISLLKKRLGEISS